MEFDPLLYAAFAVGLVAGWVVRPRSRWVPRATLATVGVLVGLFGVSLAAVPTVPLLETIPVALGVVGVIAVATVVSAVVLQRRMAPRERPAARAPAEDDQIPLSPLLIAALLVGYALGRLVALPTPELIPWVLYLLLGLVAFDLQLHLSGLRTLWIPLVAAVTGAVAGGLVLVYAVGLEPPVAFASAFGFGWYSLAGPLVAARAGAVVGLLAFLINFFRENVTMVLAPVAGRRLGGEGLSALGGATSMDTTLYLIARYGGRDAGSLALATGLIFTVVASLALPGLLSLP